MAIVMHHQTDASDPTAVHEPAPRSVCILDVEDIRCIMMVNRS